MCINYLFVIDLVVRNIWPIVFFKGILLVVLYTLYLRLSKSYSVICNLLHPEYILDYIIQPAQFIWLSLFIWNYMDFDWILCIRTNLSLSGIEHIFSDDFKNEKF